MALFGFGLSGFGLFWLVVLVFSALKVVKQYERGVKFTLGKFSGVMEPGLRFVIPLIQSWQRVDIRVKAVDVPSQECVSKDNVSLKVNAVLYYKVMTADKAIIEVEHFGYAVSQLAQTTMRNIVGEFELDEILQKREEISSKIQQIVDKAIIEVEHFGYAVSQLAQTTMRNIVGEFELDEILQKREEISSKIQQIVDKDTDPWGIKVTKIEIKDIELPETMKRAMAHQAESERDRRARVILALGESQAAAKLADAGKVMAKEPAALQLRLLQTMSDIAAEKNSTIILPVPTELLQYFSKEKK